MFDNISVAWLYLPLLVKNLLTRRNKKILPFVLSSIFAALNELIFISLIYLLADKYLSFLLSGIGIYSRLSLLFIYYILSVLIFKYLEKTGQIKEDLLNKSTSDDARSFRDFLIEYKLVDSFYIGIIYFALVFITFASVLIIYSIFKNNL